MKKPLILILAIIICSSFCLACNDNKYVGEYKNIGQDSMGIRSTYVLNLKNGGKCSYYMLMEGEIEDTLQDGISLFSGTYKIKDDKITLTFEELNLNPQVPSETVTLVGEIQSNGNIRVKLGGVNRTYVKSK